MLSLATPLTITWNKKNAYFTSFSRLSIIPGLSSPPLRFADFVLTRFAIQPILAIEIGIDRSY